MDLQKRSEKPRKIGFKSRLSDRLKSVPRIRHGLERIWLFGAVNMMLARRLRHRAWLFRPFQVPSLNIEYRLPRRLQNDEELCARLLDAYARSSSPSGASETWAAILRRKYTGLFKALEAGDAGNLAEVLSRMFQEDFVYGLAPGSLFKCSRGLFGRKIWSLKYWDEVVSLAEYLGLLRVECPESHQAVSSLAVDIHAIISAIEQSLGMSISFPDVGSPYGIVANNSLIMMEQLEHIYVGLRVNEAISAHLTAQENDALNIVEIGGGYGGLAYWLFQLGLPAGSHYTIVDLPVVNVLQTYFLAGTLGPERIALFGEPRFPTTCISIVPTHAVRMGQCSPVDVLINENSMPEMSEAIVTDYLSWARDNLRGIFYNYNKEAGAIVRGQREPWVSEIVSRIGGFARLYRGLSWVRSGYVEEVYKLT